MSTNGTPTLGAHRAVVVVGGGQAGLSMSYCLKQKGIDHVVLEKHRIAHEWRERRWDSFCLVTPNWQCRLPGFPYAGPEPHGFMLKDDIVKYVEAYVQSFGPPVIEGVTATSLRAAPGGGFLLQTSAGNCHADQVVVATGGYHVANIPRLAERLPEEVTQLPGPRRGPLGLDLPAAIAGPAAPRAAEAVLPRRPAGQQRRIPRLLDRWCLPGRVSGGRNAQLLRQSRL